jgi:hypothetical protein
MEAIWEAVLLIISVKLMEASLYLPRSAWLRARVTYVFIVSNNFDIYEITILFIVYRLNRTKYDMHISKISFDLCSAFSKN